ncbi:MAG: ATP-NAD kinase family protein [Oceanospirillaceae bacterium]|nr:ATP-NAD kinase family protein [Oceanospirillaceae bacterium]
MSSANNFKLGLLINPVAGLGGSVALKGSDGTDIQALARSLGAEPMAQKRCERALSVFADREVDIVTYPGEMGENVAKALGFRVQVVGEIIPGKTCAADTERAVIALIAQDIDLLLFAGGDGTARDIARVAPDSLLVLGIPAGVKIHSAVYAITPKAAGEVVAMLLDGKMLSLKMQEVRDIDESAFRAGRVIAKYYGELQVPVEHRYVQNVKSSGREVETLVIADIAADVVELMEEDVVYLLGSGTTVKAVMDELSLENTLLGVDVVKNNQLLASDCTAEQLLSLTANTKTILIISIIGGQGHFIGRGNQQLSAELLARIAKEDIWLLATKTKLNELEGRPLICDASSEQINRKYSGLITVKTGYHDQVLYPVAVG